MKPDIDLVWFRDFQLKMWPMAADNYRQLADVEQKKVSVGNMEFIIQHNPGRAISGGARVDKASIAARKCFLCNDARPVGQISNGFGEYDLLVNPYPIFLHHFTVPTRSHIPQRIRGRVMDMLGLAAVVPGYTVFYNGPCCGASAPDHCHFQIGDSDMFTLPKAISENGVKEVCRLKDAVLYRSVDLPVNSFIIDYDKDVSGARMLEDVLIPNLPVVDGEYEPRINVLCSKGRIIVIPRKAHRPSFYTTGETDGVMVSPASVDLGGVMVLPRRIDFDEADASLLHRVLSEVCLSYTEMEAISTKIIGSPAVYVGIMAADRIVVTFEGEFICEGVAFSGRHHLGISHSSGKLLLDGEEVESPLEFYPADAAADTAFGVEDVTIGIGFHWQRRESQRFHGSARFISDAGKVRLINRIDVEEYLLSVISSEMSASAGQEFLKAHAVISRSWLLAQIRGGDAKQGAAEMKETDTERVKWYDHDDHDLFDVCADDHCQRYQGINRQTTDEVKDAVASTRGLVLMYDGELVDARFSKCCGGVFEKFSTCWQPIDKPYLAPRRDSVNDTDFPDLRDSVEADKWISSSPEAFCNTRDIAILSQVLNSYDREDTDFYRWEVSYTRSELSELVRARSGIDFGEVVDLIPEERGTSGRISRLRIVGTKRVMTIGKELEIRRTLSASHLKSSAFIVERKFAPDSAIPECFILRGVGWGHGVGLCQIGAAVMGSRGYSYADILRHYFIGATIEKIY